MEKNSNMCKNSELCIKYVMNELDPSEIVLVENAMESDDNTLIEIESLRRTWRKLDKLPMFEPPQELTDAIASQAAAVNQNNKMVALNGGRWQSTTLMATAAAFLISVSIGIVNLYTETVPLEESAGSAAVEAESQQVEPWVDNQNVLRLQQSDFGFSLPAQSVEGAVNTARLRLIDQDIPTAPVLRDYQLTRTSN